MSDTETGASTTPAGLYLVLSSAGHERIQAITSELDLGPRPASLAIFDDIANAFTFLDVFSRGEKHPKLFQMQSTLDVLAGRNVLVRAGTGYGKTLAMILPMILRKGGIAVTVSPLLMLQNQQVREGDLKVITNTDIGGFIGCRVQFVRNQNHRAQS